MSFDFKLDGGDIKIGPSGTIVQVVDDAKLRQDLLKIILTPLGTNQLYPWYGSPINARTVGKLLDPKILKLEATNAIIYAINNLMKLQKDQERSGQFLTPSEAISQMLEVLVEQSRFDGRQFNVSVSVATRRSNVVSEAFSLAA